MERHIITPRPDCKQKIEAQGFLFHDLEGYYTETDAYSFTSAEVDKIEAATSTIFDLCMEAVEYVIKKGLWDRMFIPKQYAELITRSWYDDHCSIYGRMDLAYRNGEIKLLEFNGDTPTGLLEASVIQWYWLQDTHKSYDQFNSIHEKLLAHIKVCKPYLIGGKLHFTCIPGHIEDFMTTKYIEEVAQQAGLVTEFTYIGDLGVNKANQFVTLSDELIRNIFKLYPWEWMFHEEFGPYLNSNPDMNWIEPPWKSIVSNKMFLVILAELFPQSEYILPCTYGSTGLSSYAKKPVYGREGANVSIVRDGVMLEESEGEYGEEGYVYQKYSELPDFDGNFPVIGSWLIGGLPAGMGIRESTSLITGNTSRFVPHYFR
jgi:glutathionylspermidine synthase